MYICGHVCARENHVGVEVFGTLNSDPQACSTSAFTRWAISVPQMFETVKRKIIAKQCKKKNSYNVEALSLENKASSGKSRKGPGNTTDLK